MSSEIIDDEGLDEKFNYYNMMKIIIMTKLPKYNADNMEGYYLTKIIEDNIKNNLNLKKDDVKNVNWVAIALIPIYERIIRYEGLGHLLKE